MWLELPRSSGLDKAGCRCVAHGKSKQCINYEDESATFSVKPVWFSKQATATFRCPMCPNVHVQFEALAGVLGDARLVIFLGGFAQGKDTTCQKHGTEDVDVLALALHVCRSKPSWPTSSWFQPMFAARCGIV